MVVALAAGGAFLVVAMPSAAGAALIEATTGQATTTAPEPGVHLLVAVGSASLRLVANRMADGRLRVTAALTVRTPPPKPGKHGRQSVQVWVQINPCMAALNPGSLPDPSQPILSYEGNPLVGPVFELRATRHVQRFSFGGVVTSNQAGFPSFAEPNWTDCARANLIAPGAAGFYFQRDAIAVLTVTDAQGQRVPYTGPPPTG